MAKTPGNNAGRSKKGAVNPAKRPATAKAEVGVVNKWGQKLRFDVTNKKPKPRKPVTAGGKAGISGGKTFDK